MRHVGALTETAVGTHVSRRQLMQLRAVLQRMAHKLIRSANGGQDATAFDAIYGTGGTLESASCRI